MRTRVISLSIILILAMLPPVTSTQNNTNSTLPINNLSYSNATEVLSLSITEVDIWINRNSALFSMNLTFIGLQTSPPPGNYFYELLMGSIQSNTVQFSTNPGVTMTTRSNSSGTIINILIISSLVSKGNKIELNIKAQLDVLGQEELKLFSSLQLPSSSSLLSIRMLVPEDYEINEQNPVSHSSGVINKYKKFEWNYLQQSSYSLTLSYEIGVSNTSIVIQYDNQTINLRKGEESEFTIIVINTLVTPVTLDMSYPHWFIPLNSSIGIPALSQVNLVFKLNTSMKAGTYAGNIYILHDGEVIEEIRTTLVLSPSQISLFLLLIPVLIMIIVGLYYLYNKYKSRFSPHYQSVQSKEIRHDNGQTRSLRRDIDFDYLSRFLQDRDMQLIKFIDDHEGCTQQKIAEELELSKATVSRILNKLENRGLIKRQAHGMSNKIFVEYDNICS